MPRHSATAGIEFNSSCPGFSKTSLSTSALALALVSSVFAPVAFAVLESLEIRVQGRLLVPSIARQLQRRDRSEREANQKAIALPGSPCSGLE